MNLYHVTPERNLPEIAEHGLVPGKEPSALSSGIPSSYLQGAIFLTSDEGLTFWYETAEAKMVHVSDDPRGEGYAPIVLRTPQPDEGDCLEDELGTLHARFDAYACVTSIPPKELDYFDGKHWRPIGEWADLDSGQAWDEDDYFLVETPLLPKWDDLEENPRHEQLKRRLMR